MPRHRQRVRLEDGLKLDLNRLVRMGIVKPGWFGGGTIRWQNNQTGEAIATAAITAEMNDPQEGWLQVRLGNLHQRITLVTRQRHYGGHQWYFICPVMNQRASVLWMPPGATRFCGRQTWGRQVAYASQFMIPTDRAWRTKSKIKSRLIASLDPDDWDLPPKPKWMRWRTYARYEARFDRCEDFLDRELTIAAARLIASNFPL
jgi:hypothetical protein